MILLPFLNEVREENRVSVALVPLGVARAGLVKAARAEVTGEAMDVSLTILGAERSSLDGPGRVALGACGGV